MKLKKFNFFFKEGDMGWAACCSRRTDKVALWRETLKEPVTSGLKEKSIAWTGRPSAKVDCDLQHCQYLNVKRERTVISTDEI